MFEYPLINYLPEFILAAVWFCPGLILGIIFGWRAHVTYTMALDGSLEKEAEGFKKHTAPVAKEAAPAAEEKHQPGEFFW